VPSFSDFDFAWSGIPVADAGAFGHLLMPMPIPSVQIELRLLLLVFRPRLFNRADAVRSAAGATRQSDSPAESWGLAAVRRSDLWASVRVGAGRARGVFRSSTGRAERCAAAATASSP